MFRSFLEQDHIWFEKRAAEDKEKRIRAHEELLEACKQLPSSPQKPVFCELCAWFWEPARECGNGSGRCRVSDWESRDNLTVCWPLDRE